MGLITKEIEVNIVNNMIKYYENKGYIIPKYKYKDNKLKVKKGTKIIINIKDLPKASGLKVNVECDCCKKNYKISYSNYNKCIHNNKIYCNKCSKIVLNSGENHPLWKHDKTREERLIERSYPKYVNFIKNVLIRDNYTCKCCGDKNTKHDIEVHHLDGYNWCIEKRTDETNGITLCKNCHKNFHLKYGNGNNTKEQFEEWIGYSIGELEKYNGKLPTARKIYCIEEDRIYNNSDEISNEWNVSNTQIYQVCNHSKKSNGSYNKSIKNKHLLWYEEYENMTKEDINKYLEWCKPKLYNRTNKKVMCVTTNKIFNSIKQASEYYNIEKSSIIRCCQNKFKYAGILNREKLIWKYI